MDYILDAQLDFLYNRQERLIIKQLLYMKLEYSCICINVNGKKSLV